MGLGRISGVSFPETVSERQKEIEQRKTFGEQGESYVEQKRTEEKRKEESEEKLLEGFGDQPAHGFHRQRNASDASGGFCGYVFCRRTI